VKKKKRDTELEKIFNLIFQGKKEDFGELSKQDNPNSILRLISKYEKLAAKLKSSGSSDELDKILVKISKLKMILSNLYKKGNALLPKVTGYYSKGVKRIVRHLSDKLVSGTCACGDRQSVIKELRLFLELNKESDIVAKVKKRLEEVQKDRSTMEFNCIGGR